MKLLKILIATILLSLVLNTAAHTEKPMMVGIIMPTDIMAMRQIIAGFEQTLQKEYPHFTCTITLSRETWSGAQGRVQAHLPLDFVHKIFYLCGRQEMILEIRAYLQAKGVPAEHIKIESYG